MPSFIGLSNPAGAGSTIHPCFISLFIMLHIPLFLYIHNYLRIFTGKNHILFYYNNILLLFKTRYNLISLI